MAFQLHENAKTEGKIEIEDKKVKTGMFRLSYPTLFEPKVFKNEKSWSISMLYNKNDDISDLIVAAHNAAIEKWGSDTSKWPSKKIKSKKTGKLIDKCIVSFPFKDGDVEKPDKPEYENMIYVGANRKKDAPSVCDQKRRPILDDSGIKAGDYARAVLIAQAYEHEGKFGVKFVLMSVQKWKTGEGFGGARSAAEEFDDIEIDEDDNVSLSDMPDASEDDDEEEVVTKKSSKKASKK